MSTAMYTPPERTTPISTESCIQSRRCFMSGEHCSKQLNIYQERIKLHGKAEINAFVIMNFSDMSDVVYKWRLKDFIASLASKLYISKKTDAVICSLDNPGKEWAQVKRINVLRSDSNPASNYVICNRVCQQMQIADLIIVDVTVENTNVFYEFGMAVAMGKLILPICYNDSFFKSTIPADNTKISLGENKEQPLEKHIDCFRWRRRLFEYFGLRFRDQNSTVQYFPYDTVVNQTDANKKPLFHDADYKCFPYHQKMKVAIGENQISEDVEIGKTIYEILKVSYNSDQNGAYNTLVIYTMDGFMNGDKAGQCIINFYEHVTSQVSKMHCFCGDRVATLVQKDAFTEDNKDSREPAYLPYKIGDLIHIGMNQATYDAQRDKIVTEDFLNPPNTTIEKSERDTKIIAIKNHIGNKSLMIPLSPPIYVEHVKKGLQQRILVTDDPLGLSHYFCFFHVMLRTLQYANEIVVDISNNSVEALFWLGMAHGADIDAIAVKYDHTKDIQPQKAETDEPKNRSIFDVSGLWTAVLKSHDTEGFYHQLALAQTSIEQHFKLMLTNSNYYTERILDKSREAHYEPKAADEITKLLNDKKADEALKLESFYRNRFWARMIQQNRLFFYMPQKPDKEKKHNLHISKWDVDAIAALSHYLAQRKTVSESYIKAIEHGTEDACTANFISVGASCKPFLRIPDKSWSLADYINNTKNLTCSRGNERVRILNSASVDNPKDEAQVNCCKDKVRFRAFCQPDDDTSSLNLYALFPNSDSHNDENNCYYCTRDTNLTADTSVARVFLSPPETAINVCPLQKQASTPSLHTQLGQILLWRERPEEDTDTIKFQVSVIGASGPATYALSSIFVNEQQKKTIFPYKDSPQNHLLSHLQSEIRKDLMEKYTDALNRILTAPELIRSIKMYLSTVLYRYFFPFLSFNDEHRICNGLTAYLTALKMGQRDQLTTVDATQTESEKIDDKQIVRTLRTLMESFRCVEAMYSVEVESHGPSTDNRCVKAISPVSIIPYTSCYYTEKSDATE